MTVHILLKVHLTLELFEHHRVAAPQTHINIFCFLNYLANRMGMAISSTYDNSSVKGR